MFRIPAVLKPVPVFVGTGCIFAGGQLHPASAASTTGQTKVAVRKKAGSMDPFTGEGSALVSESTGRVENTDGRDLEKTASGLLHDSHRDDPALWAPLPAPASDDPAGTAERINGLHGNQRGGPMPGLANRSGFERQPAQCMGGRIPMEQRCGMDHGTPGPRERQPVRK